MLSAFDGVGYVDSFPQETHTGANRNRARAVSLSHIHVIPRDTY